MKKFNLYDFDDCEFPTLTGVLESCSKKEVMEEAKEEAVMESSSGVETMAMSAVMAWVDGGDYTFQALSEYVAGIADLDGDEELSDDEQSLYNDMLAGCADAFLSMGADSDNVSEFMNAEDDGAGATLGKFVSESMSEETASDDEIMEAIACGPADAGILEASFKKIRVVRGGKVTIKKKRLGKVLLSAAQKAGLKKARRKAFSATAKIHRAKSMKIRKQHGM